MNHITLKPLLAATALTLTLGTAVAAGEAANEATATPVAQTNEFKQLDSNKDNAIDKQEASASDKVSQYFDAVDANKDGRLSADEFNDAFSKSGR